MFSSHRARRALTGMIAGALAAGALAGPAMASAAASDEPGDSDVSAVSSVRKAGGTQETYVKAGDEPTGSIIAIL